MEERRAGRRDVHQVRRSEGGEEEEEEEEVPSGVGQAALAWHHWGLGVLGRQSRPLSSRLSSRTQQTPVTLRLREEPVSDVAFGQSERRSGTFGRMTPLGQTCSVSSLFPRPVSRVQTPRQQTERS
ncbi:hypothetical protein L3Q82_017435 [Scortum barcoo]|uniref:Uncharacterized protein n=1 Tax=Scortum barcoo TaxID=214431 RepID=A0ACB8VKX4_9TELE|nr:hypothetical protein L3Q82_017435 [Scortum barcoo]